MQEGGGSLGSGSVGAGARAPDYPVRLTRDLLIATQKRRLEIRPPGYVRPFVLFLKSLVDNKM